MLVEPAFEDADGGAEAIAEGDEQVDVVKVLLAGKAVGVVVAWVDGGAHLAATGAEEAEVAFDDLGGRALAAERRDGDGHGQVVANLTQQFRSKHEFAPGLVG